MGKNGKQFKRVFWTQDGAKPRGFTIMMRDAEKFKLWEDDWIRQQPQDLHFNFKILDSLVTEARALGVWPPRDPWEGMEEKIRFAKQLHV